MWRSMTAVVLLPALVAAQNSSVPPQFLQGDVPRPTYHADEQTIRQGASGHAYLLVSLGNDAIVSPRESSRGVVPLRIEFDSADGITATSISFPPHAMMRVALQNREPLHASLDSPVDSAAKAGSPAIARTPPAIPSPDETARSMAENPVIAVLNPVLGIRFNVKVPKSTPPGTHQMHGRITYQPIRPDGVFAPQQLDVVVPITVVDRNARIQGNTASAHTSASNANGNHDWIWMILLAPILIPLSILAALVGMDC